MLDLRHRKLRPDREDHGADLPHRLEHLEDLRAVGHDDGDPVADSNPALPQDTGQPARPCIQFDVRDGPAAPMQERVLAEPLDVLEGQIGCIQVDGPPC